MFNICSHRILRSGKRLHLKYLVNKSWAGAGRCFEICERFVTTWSYWPCGAWGGHLKRMPPGISGKIGIRSGGNQHFLNPSFNLFFNFVYLIYSQKFNSNQKCWWQRQCPVWPFFVWNFWYVFKTHLTNKFPKNAKYPKNIRRSCRGICIGVVGGAGACGGCEWPEFRAQPVVEQQRSVLLSWVSEAGLVRERHSVREWRTASASKFCALFLGAFGSIDLFGGGSVLWIVEHVSGGMWEGFSLREQPVKKSFLASQQLWWQPLQLVRPWLNTAGLFFTFVCLENVELIGTGKNSL